MRSDRFTAACSLPPAEVGLRARALRLLRHGRVRFGAGIAFLVLSVLMAAAASRPARAVDLDTLIGFGQSTTSGAHYRPETWTPLTVYLTGQGARGVAQLQVSVRVGEHTSIYTRRVPLKDGPINEAVNFAIQLRNPDAANMFQGGPSSDIAVQLLMDGRSLAGPKKIALPAVVASETYNVLGLTRDGSGLNLLNKKKLGLVHRHVNPNTIAAMRGMNQFNGQTQEFRNGINPDATLQVLYTDQRALPAQAQAYDMVDAIALGDQPLDNLTEEQIEAIKGFVRSGGLLVVSGGGDLARLKSQFYQELLPIVPTGATVEHDLSGLIERYKTLLPLAGGAAITRGTLKPGARVLLDGASLVGNSPLIAAWPYGCGVVVFTTFDYLDPNIKSWSAAPALWRDLLRAGNRSVSARGVLGADTQTIQNANLRLADALAGKRATTAPPLQTIALFCGAYLILLVPVNYFVLKRLDRRELTWLTAPILIAGFTIASYVIARSIKGGELTVNRAVVLETQANSDQVAGYGQMTVYSPQRAAYDISLGAPEDPANPYRGLVPSEIFSSAAQNLGQELTLDTDQNGTTLRGTIIKLWDKRSFDTPVAASMGGPVQAVTTLLPDGNTAQVIVTNRTRYNLTDCALVGDNQVPIGTLAPGESVTKSFRWTVRNGAFSLPVPVPEPAAENPDKQTDAPEVTRARIANALLQEIANGSDQNQGFYAGQTPGGFGRAANVFIGRFNDPLLDVRVNGQKTAGEEVNLLVVHLPTPAGATPAWRARFEPFAQKPVLDLDDETPPGTRKLGVFK